MNSLTKAVASGLLALGLNGVARAQNTQIMPNGIGGYNVYTPGAPTTQVMPNGIGGYNEYTPGAPTTQVMPNGIGGYNVYTPPPPLVHMPSLSMPQMPSPYGNDNE